MSNIYRSLFVILLVVFLVPNLHAQDKAQDNNSLIGSNKADLTTQQPKLSDGLFAVLYDNGPLVNSPGTGVGGADESVLQSVTLGMTTLGFGHQIINTNSMADDFVATEDWTIDEIIFYAYQTFSGTTSTINDYRVQIWDGDPSVGGSSVIWGDLTTNVLSSTAWAGIYRVSETTTGTNSDRPIMESHVTVGATFSAGTYWIEWQCGGTSASGPWAPPITITGLTTTGNGYQNLAGVWGPANDGGTLTQQGFPFVIMGSVVPVELTSFTAKANNNEVVLNWSTATETNNQGFDIERKSNGQFEKVGYVAGFGTTTEVKAYTFTDKTVGSGNYTYRLKQVDFNGTFEYSPEVEVEVSAPKVYQLSQNYPNPFNPATTINFSLATDSKVSLKIFDVIGQELAQLVNGQLAAGQHNVNFDASSLNSGVYFYKIEANGVDGTSYSSVKKMILTK
ncbi:MAG: T9SS type A sorting domain-containing protein [Ignavibacteriales bacterium]|nr:T9SS type A sorting domain-containing protein [Ignavibacteriales bacterium]